MELGGCNHKHSPIIRINPTTHVHNYLFQVHSIIALPSTPRLFI